MYEWCIRFFDKRILIVSNKDIDAYRHFEQTTDFQYELDFFEGEYSVPLFLIENKRLVLTSPRIGGHLLRQCIGFLVDYYSENHHVIHGAGVVFNDQGITLIGNRGSGKSSISRLFSTDLLIDDDILMTDGENIYTVGKNGSVKSDFFLSKRLKYLEDKKAIRNYKLSYVFLLDKDLAGGYSEHMVDNVIPRKYSVIDALPMDLVVLASKLEAIPVSCPVIKIGTRGNIRSTRIEIDRLVNNN